MSPQIPLARAAEPDLPLPVPPSAVSVAIVAHPTRTPYVDGLAATFPTARVCWDFGGGQWHNAAHALSSYDPNATHALVLEDDALPCPDLLEALPQVIARAPDAIISLYTGTMRPRPHLVRLRVQTAIEQGACLFDMRGPLWGVALVFPTPMIDGLLAWSEGRREPYDERIAAYAADQAIRCVYTYPPLVDHRQGPSVFGPRPQNRRAVAAPPDSALDVDWSGPKVVEPECGYVKRPRGWQCWWCGHLFLAEDRAKRHRCRHRV